MARLGAIALVAMVFAGCSGTEVKGIVREEGGEPLEGANVQVGDETAVTDEEGAFELEVDDDAPAKLEVDAVGYDRTEIDLNMEDGGALPSDVSLKKESDERIQTRARLAEEQERLDACEDELEADERRLFEARRAFDGQTRPASHRQAAMQQFDAWQARIDAEEEKLEAEERSLYEARRDFDSYMIDTWTPSNAANREGDELSDEASDDAEDAREDQLERDKDAAEDAEDAAEDAAEKRKDAEEEAAERAEDEAEDAADAVRKQDEEAAERAEDAKKND